MTASRSPGSASDPVSRDRPSAFPLLRSGIVEGLTGLPLRGQRRIQTGFPSTRGREECRTGSVEKETASAGVRRACASIVAGRAQSSRFTVIAYIQLHVDRATADRTILDVFGIAAGYVHQRLEALATERAADSNGIEHAAESARTNDKRA